MKSIVAAIVLELAVGQAAAQVLSDPMQPPNVPGNAAADTRDAAGPVLQSVLISGGRKVAVVDGKAMRVGDKLGKATLVSIDVAEVVLEAGGVLQVLKLYPNTQKSPSGWRKTGTQSSEGFQ